ncbi:MAG: thiol reductant ABC exporter subunit CydC [Anaerolineae bacterium]|nr:thiol reductant ABC exporter subunit CydC [Anaerolineae bacterium]
MKTFLRLLKLTTPFKWWITLAALLGFATIGSSIGLLATSAYIISRAALRPSIAVLQVAIVGVRFFGLSRGVFRYLERYVSHQVTFRLLARLRVWFYRRLEPLAPARLMRYHSGDLLARIVADIDSLEHFYVRVMAPLVVAGLVTVLMCVLLASFDLRLAVITLIFLLLAGMGIPLLTRLLSRGMGQRLMTTRAKLGAAQIDGIQGGADLLTTGRADRHQQYVQQLSQELVTLQNRMARITGLYTALSGLLTNWAALAMLLLAIPLVSTGKLDGVYLAVLVLAVMASFEAVLPLPQTWQHLEGSLTAAERLFEIVDAEPVVPDPSTPSPRPQDFGLVVKNLSFRYNAQDPLALKGISFNLPQGRRLAVMGPSGAGKSTLVNLLLRFWEYQTGEIKLGGHDLRAYQPEDVRQLIGVVSQRTHLFNGTIKQNLLLARPESTDEEVIRAARQAQIHGFIQTLPQGYDTWIGEQGLRLSGGERQRLAIARALLKNAPILILDEPTANLDPLVEREVMQTISALMQNRTTLLITHRPVGLAAADEILVLQAGHIVEQGQYHQLLQAKGVYWQMENLQNQLMKDEADIGRQS